MQIDTGIIFLGDWSPCSAACDGYQVRGVICIGGNGRRLRDNLCKAPKPESERECGDKCAPSWYLSDWSEVSQSIPINTINACVK